MVLDPGEGREVGGKLIGKTVGKIQCDKCVPGCCQEEVVNHLGERRRFGMEEGYFAFYGFILCLIFSLPILPAMKLSQPPVTLTNCVLKVKEVDCGT